MPSSAMKGGQPVLLEVFYGVADSGYISDHHSGVSDSHFRFFHPFTIRRLLSSLVLLLLVASVPTHINKEGDKHSQLPRKIWTRHVNLIIRLLMP